MVNFAPSSVFHPQYLLQNFPKLSDRQGFILTQMHSQVPLPLIPSTSLFLQTLHKLVIASNPSAKVSEHSRWWRDSELQQPKKHNIRWGKPLRKILRSSWQSTLLMTSQVTILPTCKVHFFLSLDLYFCPGIMLATHPYSKSACLCRFPKLINIAC